MTFYTILYIEATLTIALAVVCLILMFYVIKRIKRLEKMEKLMLKRMMKDAK